MKSRLIREVFILSLLVAEAGCLLAAQPAKADLQAEGRTADGTPVRVVILTTGYTASIPYQGDGLWWGTERGTDRTPLKAMVADVQVWVGKDKLFVPFSAYSDLANVRDLSIEAAELGFRLLLSGGETATSYRAELVFDKQRIKSRKVWSPLFPDERWEKTTYSFITRDM